MFLKTLTLKGFKSFAEPTTLEFEPGVTVVVGPNGSGKSNVVDAVAWVLGAQGPKTVRSTRMDDVIFAGSPSRPVLGRAEVSLLIDNSAGRLPIGLSEVTITRTLFRSGDSEYAINGAPCRLLDVQELLSDSGVGRQQHVIVGQGQLDGVLSSRPEDRRLMIEEAAGVLKYRRRREKAERRLESTEGNLLRLQDLLREVRRQLRPLERQADAARRQSGLESELRGARLYLAGRDLVTLAARRDGSDRARESIAADERAVRHDLASLDADVAAAESRLSALRESDLGDLTRRIERLTERARGLRAVINERQRAIGAARDAVMDQGVVASLRAEEGDLVAQLDRVEADALALGPAFEELAASERELRTEEEAVAATWGADDADAPSALAEVRGRLAVLRHGLERDLAEAARSDAQIETLSRRDKALATEIDRARHELEEAGHRAVEHARRTEDARARLVACERAIEDSDDARRASESEMHLWTSRSDALAATLEEAEGPFRSAALAGLDGVVGMLSDLVEVEHGWERAFEAAAADSLASVVVEDASAARSTLARLLDGGTSGAVLPALARSGTVDDHGPWQVEWTPPPADLGGGWQTLRPHVWADRPDVERLLDSLLDGVIAVDGGWEDALDVHLATGGQVVVTRDGARFSRSAWRCIPATAVPSPAALEEASKRATEASRLHAVALESVRAARAELAAARSDDQDAARAGERNEVERRSTAHRLQRAERDLQDISADHASARAQLQRLGLRIDQDRAAIEDLSATIPALEAESEALTERAAAAKSARGHLEERTAAARSLRTELEVRRARVDQRRQVLSGRLDEVRRRLVGGTVGSEELGSQQRRLQAAGVALGRLTELVAGRQEWLETARGRADAEELRRSDAAAERARFLGSAREQRAGAERRLSELRERAQRAEIEAAEIRLREETALEGVRRELDCEPEVAIAAPAPEVADGRSIAQHARDLERELRLMGPVNALALEELAALRERHDLLESQLEDVRGARRELGKVIRAIDTEIVEVFAAAYADVADHFSNLFSTLFPGGGGQLRLSDASNLLETGIEIEARPAGRNVRKLSLLSGGERSLVALAFLFAIFRSRPSPFYLMDEVEAALDDVNLHRFLDLLDEFRDEAQLIVVSHQKRTMEAADALVGVTMQTGGTSKVVTENARQAEAQPA